MPVESTGELMSAAGSGDTPLMPSESRDQPIKVGISDEDCNIQATPQAELDARDRERRQSRKDTMSAASVPGTYFQKIERLLKTLVCGAPYHSAIATIQHAVLAGLLVQGCIDDSGLNQVALLCACLFPQCVYESGSDCEVDYNGTSDYYIKYFKVRMRARPGTRVQSMCKFKCMHWSSQRNIANSWECLYHKLTHLYRIRVQMQQDYPIAELVYGADDIKMKPDVTWSSMRSSWCVYACVHYCMCVCPYVHRCGAAAAFAVVEQLSCSDGKAQL
jgi:hypothetical protein